ncbi:fumarylacetoacetate hydrolase family protein [Algoriella sp.]|uniref:fumarylacetoacetate hydrolase family protein n=1 Tax=Algoriella sp. TaxID=1872434 RepID=UPI001B17EE2C|nr:fumarylacetoacetate hydrolase family protein [Algoriella sp.]MBO6213552.1 fumarylacetoacetate hydrolase family protein [Algoriella sp.]
MKIFRFGPKGQEKSGIIIDDKKFDVSASGIVYDEDFFGNDEQHIALQKYVEQNINSLPLVDDNVRVGTPLTRPGKIVCVGLNFDDHVKETGLEQQAEPIMFIKANQSFNGPQDGIMQPNGSTKMDWETELCIVIGKKANNVTEEEAMDHVFGYALINDISERAFQTERGGTWDKGKGCDTFAPIGPYIATKEEIVDVNDLRIWLKLNGELMQDGNTSDFIYQIPKLISYLSQFMSFLPGDIISTGSPAGSGMGKTPQVWLKPGDVIEYGIEGLGSTTQTILPFAKN